MRPTGLSETHPTQHALRNDHLSRIPPTSALTVGPKFCLCGPLVPIRAVQGAYSLPERSANKKSVPLTIAMVRIVLTCVTLLTLRSLAFYPISKGRTIYL
nr:hypothetical protein CFP56_00947 [Quercus suber]